MYSHILITTDGSELAQRGVDHGLKLAKALGAKTTVLTVTERLPVYPDAIGGAYAVSAALATDYRSGQAQTAAANLAGAQRSAEALGVSIETVHVDEAQPAEAILETAAARGCDLIVMASHGRRGLGRMLLGSKTAEVVAQSQTPVLVVR